MPNTIDQYFAIEPMPDDPKRARIVPREHGAPALLNNLTWAHATMILYEAMTAAFGEGRDEGWNAGVRAMRE